MLRVVDIIISRVGRYYEANTEAALDLTMGKLSPSVHYTMEMYTLSTLISRNNHLINPLL